jgi:hypothetical protein
MSSTHVLFKKVFFMSLLLLFAWELLLRFEVLPDSSVTPAIAGCSGSGIAPAALLL